MATIVLGSADAPVILDPAQIITEVGWSSKYIAARLDIGMNAATAGETGEGPGPAFEDPWAYDYLSGLTLFYSGGAMKSPAIFSGGQWHSIPSDETEFTGEPSLPGPYSYGAWVYSGSGSSPGSAPAGMIRPFHRYEASGEGSELDAYVPGSPGQKFTAGSDVSLRIRANDYAEGPFASPTSGIGALWAKGTVYLTPDAAPVIETETISASGIGLTYRAKTYVAVGTKCIPGTELLRGEFWVLFEKVTE